jgi:ammonia channel protein AmtB
VTHLDTGDTAWLLTCTALVLLMTPGLAFFYGGMVRAKNVLAMLMQNYVAIGVVTVTWVLVGYSPSPPATARSAGCASSGSATTRSGCPASTSPSHRCCSRPSS